MSHAERIKYVSDMQAFIQQGYQNFGKILNTLGWNESEFKFPVLETVKCPLEEGHYVTRDKFDEHVELCNLKKEGYSKDETLLPPATGDAKFAIKIDAEIRKKVLSAAFNADPTLKLGFRFSMSHRGVFFNWKLYSSSLFHFFHLIRYDGMEVEEDHFYAGVENILEDQRPVPKSVDRCLSEFTVDERRILYDFAVRYTSRRDPAKNEHLEHLYHNIGITSGEPSKTSKTLEEMMIALRDAKRRRASYKGKKVKAKSRSYTQTLKNLIETQMDTLKELNGDESTVVESEIAQSSGETITVDESSCQERPKQLYEKQYMSADRWLDLGDWVPRRNISHFQGDSRRLAEKYESKSSYHSSHRDKKYNDDTDNRHRSRDSSRADKDKSQRRSVSPKDSGKFKGDNYWSHLSTSLNKTIDDSREEIYSSHSRSTSSVKHDRSSINRHKSTHDSKTLRSKFDGKIKEKISNNQNLKRKSRSRSHSHSKRSKKHKSERKGRHKDTRDDSSLDSDNGYGKKHKSEREGRWKSSRHDSNSDESDSRRKIRSRESSSECKHRSSHKKKKKKKSSREER